MYCLRCFRRENLRIKISARKRKEIKVLCDQSKHKKIERIDHPCKHVLACECITLPTHTSHTLNQILLSRVLISPSSLGRRFPLNFQHTLVTNKTEFNYTQNIV